MIKFSQKNVEKIDILNLIDDEILAVEVSLTFQKKLNEQVLSYLRTFMDENPFTNDSDNINVMSDYLGNTSKILKKTSTNLVKFQSLQSKLYSMRKSFNELKQPSLNFTKTQFDDYNKKYSETMEKCTPFTIEIQTFLAQCQQDDILKELLLERELSQKAEFQKIENIKSENDEIITKKDTVLTDSTSSDDNDTNKVDLDIYPELSSKETVADDSFENTDEQYTQEIIEKSAKGISDSEIPDLSDNIDTKNNEEIISEITSNHESSLNEMEISETNNTNTKIAKLPSNIVENTLIISEKNGNVILPYTLEELNNTLAKNPFKYDDIEDVISKKYTKSIKYYKNSSIARFKETFKLVRERGNGSLKHAWDLSLEAFFNYDLHPAIISACKSVDELDIYLSCLEYDELEDFRFFKIIFDVLPTLSKKKKINI